MHSGGFEKKPINQFFCNEKKIKLAEKEKLFSLSELLHKWDASKNLIDWKVRFYWTQLWTQDGQRSINFIEQ